MTQHPMVRVQDIYNFIDLIAPFETAESWDNVGLLIGNFYAPAEKVLLSLDITEEVVAEAIEGDFDLIVTHHPIIFTGIKSITTEDRIGRLLLKLIQHKISVIAAHTNLDRSFEYGINHTIAERYHLQSIEPLNALHKFGIIGELSEDLPIEDFIQRTKSIFGIHSVKLANIDTERSTRMLHTVAISSGASSDFIEDALAMKADIFITADLKYHEAQTAIGTGLILVDVGHFESESIFLKPFKAMLDTFAIERALKLMVQVTESEKPIFKYF